MVSENSLKILKTENRNDEISTKKSDFLREKWKRFKKIQNSTAEGSLLYAYPFFCEPR